MYLYVKELELNSYGLTCFYMDVDKWTQCGHCAILGIGWDMLLYIIHVGFWIELPVQRRICPIFLNNGSR